MEKKVNVTKFECPVCHAQFALPQHQYVTTGMVIGQDSGLGTVHPMLADEQNGGKAESVAPVKMSKSEAKIDALRKAGIKGKFFAISGTGLADGSIARMNDDGNLAVVADDDPIFAAIAKEIIKKGDIANNDLFRRWMLGQYVAGELSTDRYGNRIGFTKYIHRKGYEYTLRTLLEEFRVQSRLWSNKDLENYNARVRWMNKMLGISVMEHDIRMAREFVNSLPTRHCKGREYKRIHGRDIFVDELEEKLFSLMEMALDKFRTAENSGQMYVGLDVYMKHRIKLPFETEQCREWVDAYKGVGAYYNLRNMIMFHGCLISSSDDTFFTKEESLACVERYADEYANGYGWCMLGMFRQMLRDNNIDIAKMQKEWRSK